MNQVWGSKVPLYFETEQSQLVLGDSFKILTKMKPESVDMIFADPPYFLSNDGITCQGGKMVSVNKGSWDKLSESGTGVEEKHKFNRKWIKLCRKVLKPNGTIWISGTLHNIYGIGAGRLQNHQQHYVAENKSTTKLSMSMLHTFYGNHIMGTEE